MKVYRAIEFDKLFHLTDRYFTLKFKDAIKETRKKNKMNWWYLNEYENLRMQVLRNIYDNQRDFFQKSIDFNSKNGGRFNPERSYGCIYTASCPNLAALEVLYHSFERNRGLYRNLKKSSEKISNAFNITIPENFTTKIVVFEIETQDEDFNEVCGSTQYLRNLCTNLGFSRYINNNFDENFIFGNDYDIGNIIGCYYHATSTKNLKIPSARLPLKYQKDNEKFNIIIYENRCSKDIKLTGNIKEYIFKVNLEEEKKQGYKIDMKALGRTTKRSELFLQPWPSKSNNQIVEYHQITDKDKKYSRLVKVQKFHDGSYT